MAKPNYGFEKRQRELEKKRKKQEKALKKAAGPTKDESPDQQSDGGSAPQPAQE